MLIEEIVAEIAGEDAAHLVRILADNPNMSEFKLAEKMNKNVHETRNLLYKLYSVNLASFIRKKDNKKGWYIYYWKLHPGNAKHVLKSIRKEKKEVMTGRLKRELTGNFFLCPAKCMRLDFDGAFDFDFKCPECGSIMNQEDNSEKIRAIQRKLKNLQLWR